MSNASSGSEAVKKESLRERLKAAFHGDALFHETEVQANRLGALIMLCNGLILALILTLTVTGVFPLSLESMYQPTLQGIAESLILLLICRLVKYDAWWLKNLLMLGMVLVYARLDSLLTHKAAILMVLPVVFSSRYFSRKLTVTVSLLTGLVFALSSAWGATHGFINLNIVTMPAGVEIITTGGFLGEAVENAGVSPEMLVRNTLLYDYLPKWFMFSIAAIISCNIAKRGREMVVEQHEKDMNTARIEYELSLANRIQADMLPNTFPAFPDRSEFDIYAAMDQAKEVGGDFYDFFLIDDSHLGIVVADVSGKGVPAALFMMAAKILIKNIAMTGKSPGEVLEAANEQICSNNREEMFVTVWLGILDLRTGNLVAANAGHEYPVLKKADGSFHLLKDTHGFVLGGLDGSRYKNYELQLAPDDVLFLYTDGLPEATNAADELYGTKRMLEALNRSPGADPRALLESIEEDVNAFVGGAQQFDDLTMLCVQYKGMKEGTQIHRWTL